MKRSIPWGEIKKEYCAGVMTGELAKKYGVNRSTVARRAKQGGWATKRLCHSLDEVPRAGGCARDDALLLQSAARAQLSALASLLESGTVCDVKSAKMISSALRDIKDILSIRSDLDIDEQKARIASLRRQAEDEDKTITVVLTGDLEDYSG